MNKMVNKLWKHEIPRELILSFLDEHFDGMDEIIHDTPCYTYRITLEGFKRIVLNHALQPWLDKCMPYYYPSKQYYLTRPMTYTSFATILRQCARHYGWQFSSACSYRQSTRMVEYRIRISDESFSVSLI